MTPEELCDAVGIPFSDEQLRAITAPLEPAVIIAGAGTGKTTVMAARVVWLVATGQVRADEVLGLTFTRKAAAELAERVDDALNAAKMRKDEESMELISTYDSFAAQIVREFGVRGGLDFEPLMITGATRFRLAEQAVRDAMGPFPMLSRLSLGTIPERVLQLDAAMQSHLVDSRQLSEFNANARAQFLNAPGKGKNKETPYVEMVRAADTCAERAELLQLVDKYRSIKTRLGVVEFADQLRIAESLVRTVPSVANEMRRRYKIVLLDEYQDTSSAQAKLLTGLFAGHAVTAVGDPYQAIYGWRGAAAQNILDFPHHFGGGTAQRYTLSVNRRSATRILDIGNELAKRIPGDGVTLLPPPEKPAGRVETATFDTFNEELDWIAQSVASLEGDAEWKEIAVLCRRNQTLGPIFEALRERDIPVEIVGLEGLLDLPEIAPVVAFLRVLADASANPSIAMLLTTRWNLHPSDLALLGRRARLLAGDRPASPEDLHGSLSTAVQGADPSHTPMLLEAVDDPPEELSDDAKRKLASFRAALSRFKDHLPLLEVVQRAIRILGVEEELLARGKSTDQLAHFVAECARYVDVEGRATVSGLVAFLDAEWENGDGLEQAVVSEDNSVKLLSVHRAKGLEWDHVFLPELVARVFPSEYRSGYWPTSAYVLPAPLRGDADAVPQMEGYEEPLRKAYNEGVQQDHTYSEDRLAYVAATRARTHLVGTSHVWSPGIKRPKSPSPYFSVIEKEARKTGDATDFTTGQEENPILEDVILVQWPGETFGDSDGQRQAAQLVVRAEKGAEWAAASGTVGKEVEAQWRRWDESAAHALAARVPSQRVIRLPRGMSATALIALRNDPQAFAESLVRRMPREPSAGASLGTQFHEWVERRFGSMLRFEEFDARSPELDALVVAFEKGRFANLTPIEVEIPFAMAIGEYQIRGRIDAAYQWDGHEYDEIVVDWKTFQRDADPLQLAVYRRAWAESRGIPEERVGAAFYYVRTDRLVFTDARSDEIMQAFEAKDASGAPH